MIKKTIKAQQYFAHQMAAKSLNGLLTTALGLLFISVSGCTTAPVTGSQSPNTSPITGAFGVPNTERTLAQRVLDESIEHTARVNIYALNETLRDNSRLKVDSFYSDVLLTGEVPDENTKQEITKIVSSMPDVKNLYNYLNVSRIKGTSYTLHDGYLTSKIKAKVLANNQIRSSQVKAITDDGVVYILGKLTPSEQGQLIDIINDTVGIKELRLLNTVIDNNGAVLDRSTIIQETGLEPPALEPEYSQDAASATYPANDYSAPAVTTPPAVSPYIELYKNQVSGW